MPPAKKSRPRAQQPPAPRKDRELHPDAGAAHRFIIQLGLVTNEMERRFSRKIGISTSRLELLDAVFHAGEISQRELVQQLSMDASLVTRFVKQMEQEGLVKRRADPQDNRYTLVSLGPTAPQAIELLQTMGYEFQNRVVTGVSDPELERTIRVLQRVMENLESWD